MKKIIFLLLFPAVCLGQKDNFAGSVENGKYLGIMPIQGESIVYTGVVVVDSSLKKDELYNRAKRFFVDAYKSSKDVIQLDDKENGEIDGKGNFEVTYQYTFMQSLTATVPHTIKIFMKDGKYKYEISNLSMHYYSAASQYSSSKYVEMTLEQFGQFRKNNAKKFIKSVDIDVEGIIASLKVAMTTKRADNF